MITFTIRNKQRPKATIIMLVSLYGKQYQKSIGIGVPAKMWNEKKKRAKVTADFDGNYINDRIELWEGYGKETVKHFSALKESPTNEDFIKYLTDLAKEEDDDLENRTADKYFCAYIENIYIPRYTYTKSPITIKKYFTALNKLKKFECSKKRKLTFSDINIDFYNQFQRWFFNQDYSANYFGTIVKFIKQVFSEAKNYDKLHNCDGTNHKDFITVQKESDSVYLDLSELKQIEECDISIERLINEDSSLSLSNAKNKNEALSRTKSLFLIGCYTGLRVSDFSRLSEAHIGDKNITINTYKTDTTVVIPIHPVIRSIIDSGFDFSVRVSDQKLNKQIKELCKLSGIDKMITVNKNIGGKKEEESAPKYTFITNHTARRSFATNAYKAGIPTIAIMKITGHTKESTFLKYIKVSAEENAEILSQHPFFN
ncbi:MAG: tyrosine-type recombinase/integrase [Rikenellaceae bacterium]